MDTKVTKVRAGRNFIRVGDPVKVRLPGKTQFTSGWTVKEIDGDLLRVSKDGHWRYVDQCMIKRVAVTKNGEKK